MALTLVTGLPNAGKSGRLYSPIIESAKAGESPVVALPSAPDARRVADEFTARGVGGVRTVVLDRWIGELWALYGDGRRLVQTATREVLARRACAVTALTALEEAAQLPGLVTLVAALAETAPNLTAVKAGSPEDRDVLAALERYTHLLDLEGLVEPASAAASLGTNPPELGGPVAINRFTDLSAAQEAFICGLASCVDVGVALPWDKTHPATEAVAGLVNRLSLVGQHTHVDSPEPEGELQHFERELFGPREVLEPTGEVVFGEAASPELEIVLALDCAAECIEAGVAPERIAVLFRDAASRMDLARAAAQQVGIDINLDVTLALSATHMGRALLALMDVAAGRDLTRGRLMGFLASPYSGATGAQIEDLDARWRRARTSGTRLLDDAARIEPLSRAIRSARRLAHAASGLDAVETWKYLVDSMLVAADERRGLAHEAGSWDCAVHRTVLEVISSLADTREGLHEPEARIALARASVSRGGPERIGEVVFTEAHRVRSRRFDVVIVGGLTAAEFSAQRARPFAAEWLEGLGLPTGPDSSAAERLLFHTLATRPRKRLYLLRSVSDMSGDTVRPSVFWEESLDLYRTFEDVRSGTHPKGIPVRRLGQTSLAREAVAYTPGRRKTRSAVEPSSMRPPRGVLLSDRVRDALASRDEFSVSELEVYATCPYRWFFERALRPRELDVAFEAREAGSMAHEVLATFYTRWSADGEARRITPGTLSEAREVARTVFEEVMADSPRPADLVEELTREEVCRWVMNVIEDDATWLPEHVPFAHEVAFGKAEGCPFEFGGVLLRGRVDRVDVDGVGLVVTDYKSASTVYGHGSFVAQGVLQLPVYLAAAAQMFELPPHGGVFRSLRSRSARGLWLKERFSDMELGKRTDGVTSEEMATILADAQERVAHAAEGIRAGEISPRAGGCSSCRTCTARSLCKEAAEV
ncbi:MAG: PD-(D/E)XK nuclease family protein [Coriobacteriia bacterium]|jgi:RecB family exonuclease|nr:PD-(D/E)XK nuclease family protein [Coriobacteriia bacterium]